jgi:HSP20 family molecular chaperone IbpA
LEFEEIVMQCPICGTKIEKEWSFCPRCGARISGDFFEEIMGHMRKELAEMSKLLDVKDKDIEAFDLSPWFKNLDKKKVILTNPKGSGFSIKIVQSGGKEPEVSVRTFGDVDKNKLKKEMNGMEWGPEGKPESRGQKVVIRESMKTEEPKTSVARSSSKVIVSMEMPGVKSDKDIEVSELESSIEVKALAGDKAYFKILTKPAQFRLSRKNFEKGTLHMEFS